MGKQIIDPEWLRGHSGGNKSGVSGESKHYTAIGMVTTDGIDHPHLTERVSFLPRELFVGPVKLDRQVSTAKRYHSKIVDTDVSIRKTPDLYFNNDMSKM